MGVRMGSPIGLAVFALSGLALASLSAPAIAGGLYAVEERVHADSFGNLVIHSPAGYKRILVGKGHLVDQYAAHAEVPRVVYLDDEAYRVRNVYRCNRQPVLLHGRSYMYGLPDNVVPVPAGICR